jgi:hypothetical protein
VKKLFLPAAALAFAVIGGTVAVTALHPPPAVACENNCY